MTGTDRTREDGDITLDDRDDDWEWRRRIRANPHSRRVYRVVVAAIGLLIVASGLALVPLPGPGWVIVFGGLAVWATEFEWAQRLLRWAKRRLHVWNVWMKQQRWWTKGLVGLGTLAAVAALFYGYFALTGVPAFTPDLAETWLTSLPGL